MYSIATTTPRRTCPEYVCTSERAFRCGSPRATIPAPPAMPAPPLCPLCPLCRPPATLPEPRSVTTLGPSFSRLAKRPGSTETKAAVAAPPVRAGNDRRHEHPERVEYHEEPVRHDRPARPAAGHRRRRQLAAGRSVRVEPRPVAVHAVRDADRRQPGRAHRVHRRRRRRRAGAPDAGRHPGPLPQSRRELRGARQVDRRAERGRHRLLLRRAQERPRARPRAAGACAGSSG